MQSVAFGAPFALFPRLTLPGDVPPSQRAIAISTSDELCLHLASLKAFWKILPLQYHIAQDVPSLLHMVITGQGEEFKVAAQVKTAVAKVLHPVFEMEDPVASGQSSAQAFLSHARASERPNRRPPDPPSDSEIEAAELHDVGFEDEWAGVEPDIAFGPGKSDRRGAHA